MIADNSDKSWETLGRTDPYYGVLTSERFRSKNLDASARDEFFASGSQSMVDLLKNIEGKLGPIARGSALDFGCGVGRLVLPLAAELGFESATGVDISPSMLAEARKNADRAGLKNIEFVVSDDGLSRLQGTFDFIHSFIVLHEGADVRVRFHQNLRRRARFDELVHRPSRWWPQKRRRR